MCGTLITTFGHINNRVVSNVLSLEHLNHPDYQALIRTLTHCWSAQTTLILTDLFTGTKKNIHQHACSVGMFKTSTEEKADLQQLLNQCRSLLCASLNRCLVNFGVSFNTVLDSLTWTDKIRQRSPGNTGEQPQIIPFIKSLLNMKLYVAHIEYFKNELAHSPITLSNHSVLEYFSCFFTFYWKVLVIHELHEKLHLHLFF